MIVGRTTLSCNGIPRFGFKDTQRNNKIGSAECCNLNTKFGHTECLATSISIKALELYKGALI